MVLQVKINVNLRIHRDPPTWLSARLMFYYQELEEANGDISNVEMTSNLSFQQLDLLPR